MMKRVAMAFAVCVAGALPVSAATNTIFNYEGTVTSTTVSDGTNSFGDFGDPAMITFDILADAAEAIPVGFTSGGQVGISVSGSDFDYDIDFVPDGFNDGFNSSISVNTTRVFFATSSGVFNWPGVAGNTLRTTLAIEFGAALVAAPATYGDLVSALQAPGSQATFITNGDFLFTTGATFDEFSVSATPAVPPVPLPAGAWLLLSGVAGFALLRPARRRVG